MNARTPVSHGPWPNEVDLDDLFDALAHPRRRFVIDQVADLDEFEQVSVDDLATGRAFMETDAETIEAVSDRAAEEVRSALVHKHLPKLGATGLVSFDDGAEAIARTPATKMAADTVLHALRKRSGNGPSRGAYR